MHKHRWAVIGVAYQPPHKPTATTFSREMAQYGASTVTERCERCPAVRSRIEYGRVVVPEIATVLVGG